MVDDASTKHCDVLIVGAGPTGLVLALCLTRLGVKVRIVDKTDRPGTTSRALAVQARTLELYRALDLDREIVARGHATRAGKSGCTASAPPASRWTPPVATSRPFRSCSSSRRTNTSSC